ncbi:hypothetical protein KIPB_011813 [Kipferlia bialata]|uniref:DM10 domain-containing protein n=1 Tax=Kipferlia bialata TaxID=797122 RepID=A0A9K3GMJ5_9EUKA|nr:hypothetical protein KIPB_011813 [Kipferlia bialata]|eukprot:g11813.t1
MGLWDDRQRLFGELRRLVVHYYLADDTVEVLEVMAPNSGRDPFPKFLGRQRLPINNDLGLQMTSVMNAEGTFVSVKDLVIGQALNVFGRKVFLYDCDSATRKYMVNVVRVDPSTLVPAPTPKQEFRAPVKMVVPPPTGFGSEADSLGSCNSLDHTAPRKDFHRWLKYDGQVLRFLARLVGSPDGSTPCNVTDSDRRFVVSYFLADNTMSVFESGPLPAGAFGRKYLDRGEVTNPLTEKNFEWSDINVGNVVTVYKRHFEILDLDERTRKIVAELSQK